MSDQNATSSAPSVQPITIEIRVRLKAVALLESDGGYSVAVPALPGCGTQGDTIEDVKANLLDAAEAWLDVDFDQNKDEAIRSMLP